ncbi:GNAT family N-acetyltransferase [Hymenobacter weizhouensis]|nr:hypothetical protein [Hymenobacter sp. YIM 151500-1]UYZ62143.1 hypothetical protein OIS53_14150 [Hymenobacter sp. YIM 151500-1]
MRRCSATNDNARHLYVSEGFTPVGREPRAIKWEGQYFDEDKMVLFLK